MAAIAVLPEAAPATMRARSFGDMSFGGDGSYETVGLGLGAELTRAWADAFEYGGRFRFEWADHLMGTYCEEVEGSGCTKTTRDVAALMLLGRLRARVGAAGTPVVYIAGTGGFVNTRTSIDIVSPGSRASASTSYDQAFGVGADIGLEFSQSNRWRGFVEIGATDIDAFHGFAPAMSLRTGAVYEWQ